MPFNYSMWNWGAEAKLLWRGQGILSITILEVTEDMIYIREHCKVTETILNKVALLFSENL